MRKRYFLIVILLSMFPFYFTVKANAFKVDGEQAAQSELTPGYQASKARFPAAQSPYPFTGISKSSESLSYARRSSEGSAINEGLAKILWKAAGGTGSFAKNVGQGFGDYMKERQLEKKQQELVERFYLSLEDSLEVLKVSPSDAAEVTRRVEELYIEDGQTERYQLDPIYFREMSVLVKKIYGDIQFEKTQDGTVNTYYLNGVLKARWQMKGGKPHGSVVTYYEDGEIRYIDVYANGNKIRRQKYDKEGKLEFEQNYQYGLETTQLQVPETPPSPEI